MNSLLCFGLGYSARELAARLASRGWAIAGTSRSEAGATAIRNAGYDALVFDGQSGHAPALSPTITHVLVSPAPGPNGCPALNACSDQLHALPDLQWIGYLSTVGVYGDFGGAWINEATPPQPVSQRGRYRVVAENAWLEFGGAKNCSTQVFRLAGIYGPGRGPLEKLRNGTAHRIIKPNQVFARIHVEDIAAILEASIARPRHGAIYNCADNEPAPPQDVTTFGAELLGIDPPPEIAFEEADMTAMARSFYSDNKRVGNALLADELGVTLKYPTYREGLAALAKT